MCFIFNCVAEYINRELMQMPQNLCFCVVFATETLRLSINPAFPLQSAFLFPSNDHRGGETLATRLQYRKT